jgi:CrcB protein
MFASIVAVACGGALGAVARFITVVISQYMFGERFPIGTLFVNCFGSFLIGLFMSLCMDRLADVEYWRLFVVVGFLGAYTTFSSFAWDTLVLYTNGQWLAASINILLNNVITITLLLMGMHTGRLFGGYA